MPGVQRGGGINIQVMDAVSVTRDDRSLSGHALGGRRARVALVALALAEGPVPAERLAAVIWAGELPPTWPAALRGVVRGLRSALAGIGAGGQLVIATTPAGYRLAAGTRVDARDAVAAVRSAARLAGQGRHHAALEAALPAAALSGERLLPGEDGPWLEPPAWNWTPRRCGRSSWSPRQPVRWGITTRPWRPAAVQSPPGPSTSGHTGR